MIAGQPDAWPSWLPGMPKLAGYPQQLRSLRVVRKPATHAQRVNAILSASAACWYVSVTSADAAHRVGLPSLMPTPAPVAVTQRSWQRDSALTRAHLLQASGCTYSARRDESAQVEHHACPSWRSRGADLLMMACGRLSRRALAMADRLPIATLRKCCLRLLACVTIDAAVDRSQGPKLKAFRRWRGMPAAGQVALCQPRCGAERSRFT